MNTDTNGWAGSNILQIVASIITSFLRGIFYFYIAAAVFLILMEMLPVLSGNGSQFLPFVKGIIDWLFLTKAGSSNLFYDLLSSWQLIFIILCTVAGYVGTKLIERAFKRKLTLKDDVVALLLICFILNLISAIGISLYGSIEDGVIIFVVFSIFAGSALIAYAMAAIVDSFRTKTLS